MVLNAIWGLRAEVSKKYIEEGIELNVKVNPRNTEDNTMEYTYFDEKLLQGEQVQSGAVKCLHRCYQGYYYQV